MFSKELHRNIYIFSLILIAIFLPLSKYLLSVSQFILALNWVLEFRFVDKWHRIRKNTPALLVMLLFIIHLVWLANTQDFDYAWHDIKIKVPLFILPFLLGSSDALRFKELKLILYFFIAATVLSAIISSFVFIRLSTQGIAFDTREISIFISHIRLSLMVNMAIFSAFYLIKKSEIKKEKLILLISLFSLFLFLFILKSYTGIVLFFVLLFLSLFVFKTTRLSSYWRSKAYITTVLAVLTFAFFTIKSIQRFYNIDNLDTIQLSEKTINNNPYQHDINLKAIENGHFVWINVCEKELEENWNRRSKITYHEKDARQQVIKYTLIHYLTSLNFKKDSAGVWSLSEEDIVMIQKGFSNHIYKESFSLYKQLYPIMTQIYNYKTIGYANGASITQRFEYLKIAKKIITNNFLYGTGTGDLEIAFHKHYQNKESILNKHFQYRAHNQFVTFFISFGIFGGLLSLFILIYPFYLYRKYYLSSIFAVIVLLSMLNEDTLETQAGASFYAFFSALLLASFLNNKKRM